MSDEKKNLSEKWAAGICSGGPLRLAGQPPPSTCGRNVSPDPPALPLLPLLLGLRLAPHERGHEGQRPGTLDPQADLCIRTWALYSNPDSTLTL